MPPRFVWAAVVLFFVPLASQGDEKNLAIKLDDFVYATHIMGPEVPKDQLRGKVVLVEFWGINCRPCLQSMPHLNKLYNELRDFGLVLVAPHAQKGSQNEIRSRAT